MPIYQQNTLTEVSDAMFLQLPRLLQHFNVDYYESSHAFHLACPIHGGDNPQGCAIFKESYGGSGGWQCFTNSCQDEYKRSFFGFIRGLLSSNIDSDEDVTMHQTMEFCLKFLNCDISDLENHTVIRDESHNTLQIFNRELIRKSATISRENIRERLQIPSKYFMERGYSAEVLDEFDVGLSSVKSGIMRERVVVPVYDEDYNYVSCVGRLPHENITPQNPKWMYNKGFQKSNFLYGLNIAKDYIQQTGTVILVEGQGDVWRLHEAGYKNCVGIFGADLSDDQVLLLERSGALNVIILTDSDNAGTKAYEKIIAKCGRRFNYFRPTIPTKDVGDMTIDQIEQHLKPQIERVCNGN